MKIFINIWGEESKSVANAFINLVNMGMIRDADINIRFVSFSKLEHNYFSKYKSFYELNYNCILNCKDILLEKLVLSDKYEHNNEYLNLVYTNQELQTDISLYNLGRKKICEILYRDETLDELYSDLPSDDNYILINCGTYYMESLGSIFIPIESTRNIRGKRFNIITGPSIKPSLTDIKIPYPDIYSSEENISKTISIFDIPTLLLRLQKIKFSYDDQKTAKHKENVYFLQGKNNTIFSTGMDISGLNPKYYYIQFLDSLYSTIKYSEAIFINMKNIESKTHFYDETLKIEKHLFTNNNYDIISLINALTIKEIIENSNYYTNGKVFSFGLLNTNQFEIKSLFSANETYNFVKFILLSAMVVKYIPYLILTNLEKEKKKYSQGSIDRFKLTVNNFLKEYSENCIFRVFDMFFDISRYSGNQHEMFPENLKAVFEKIRSEKEMICNKNELYRLIVTVLKALIDYRNIEKKASVFIDEYNKEFDYIDNLEQTDCEITNYMFNLIGYTVKRINSFMEEQNR